MPVNHNAQPSVNLGALQSELTLARRTMRQALQIKERAAAALDRASDKQTAAASHLAATEAKLAAAYRSVREG